MFYTINAKFDKNSNNSSLFSDLTHWSFMRIFNVFKLAIFVSILALSSQSFAETEESNSSKPLKEIEFLGLKLVEANLETVRSHLWNIGGFQQALSTVKQRNIDKFYPWSTIRDSYYVTFQYNYAGNITSVKRVYRPYSILNKNKRTPIETKDIAMSLVKEIGQPKFIKRQGWGGGLSYLSYTWQDDDIEVKIDREGSEVLGNVFIEYIIKTNKRYEVNKDDNNAI